MDKHRLSLIALLAARAVADDADADASRARQRVPGPAFRGHGLLGTNAVLNRHLLAWGDRTFEPCEAFDHAQLRDVQRALLPLADGDLASIYRAADGRARRFETLEDLAAHHARVDAHISTPEDALAHRDGLCTEIVMWLVHHLPADARRSLSAVALPLLPDAEPPATSAAILAERDAQVSCQQCHTGDISEKWQNATLPPPLDGAAARKRVCDYQHFAARVFRGDGVAATPRPRRGNSAEIAATPRPRRGRSAETSGDVDVRSRPARFLGTRRRAAPATVSAARAGATARRISRRWPARRCRRPRNPSSRATRATARRNSPATRARSSR